MSATIEESLARSAAVVRPLREEDVPDVVRIDAEATGRHRPRYFELMLQRALKFPGLQITLVAELDGRVVGYLIGSLWYGEHGLPESSASLDAMGVASGVRRHRVGHALMHEFRQSVQTIGATSIRAEMNWDDFEILAFFRAEGFIPSARVCLETTLDIAPSVAGV